MLYFNDDLTLDNISVVVKIIREMLTGKKYTFVTVNENCGYPEIRLHQEMDSISEWKTESCSGFNVGDSYGVWGCATNMKSTNENNKDLRNPYISIEHKQILIHHRAPAGNLLYWLIVVED